MTGAGLIASPPKVDPLAPRICTIPDARWSKPGEPVAVDCFSDPRAAIAGLAARGHQGSIRVTTVTLRCVLLAAFNDADLKFFNCSLTEFEARSSAASQDIMSWVRMRWGLDGIATRALHDVDALNVAVTGERDTWPVKFMGERLHELSRHAGGG